MKTFITIILFVTNVVVSLAQAVDTTIFVCRNDTLHLTNTQFLGSTLRQNGVIYVVDSATCDYSTIPEDYVFDPPYDTLPHSETYILKFDSIGAVYLKKADYNFNGLVYFSHYKYIVRDCRFPDHPGNDTIVIQDSIVNFDRSLPYRAILMTPFGVVLSIHDKPLDAEYLANIRGRNRGGLNVYYLVEYRNGVYYGVKMVLL